MSACRVKGCERPRDSFGYCMAHAMRLRRHGDPLHGGPIRPRRSTKQPPAESVRRPSGPAHPYAAKRAALDLPPASRHERLAALAALAESHPTPERYEAEKARILSQEEA